MDTYVWGSNKHHQISSKNELHIYQPLLSSDFEGQSISKVAAGESHSLILTDFGDIYSLGRGNEGQLGHCSKQRESNPRIISSLAHETIFDIACGSLTSYAVTTTGRVYHWGLVHKSASKDKYVVDTATEPVTEGGVGAVTHVPATDSGSGSAELETVGAASGELTGMAASQDSYVPIDEEARRTNDYQSIRPGASRQLRDIVRESTERWMLATDGADEEYLREMASMGYRNEELEEMASQRGREYHGMLRLGCRREVVSTPERVSGLDQLRVVAVAAGYAHCILITHIGHMYAAGYNDRGQLGLGHRIGTSQFKWVDYLAGKFVLQVACGQQHTVCRAVDRKSYGSGFSSELYVGSALAADVYTWGNGMLGQLGLGRRGTSKGRLLPTLVTLFDNCHTGFPGSVDVSAGHNFTACVLADGRVYSWGHAEYNQHGTGATASSDHIDAFFYYQPHEVIVPLSKRGSKWSGAGGGAETEAEGDTQIKAADKIIKISCGANFTIAMTRDGDVYSWGWNEAGVLGHGIGHFNPAPSKIMSIGPADEKPVSAVATGCKHVVVCVSQQSDQISCHFRHLLISARYADVYIRIDRGLLNVMTTTASATSSSSSGAAAANGAELSDTLNAISDGNHILIPCHRIILACRSSYLRGYIQQISPETTNSQDIGSSHLYMPCIDLSDYSCANLITIRALLEYIYLDKLNIVPHKRKQLAELAKLLCMDRLHDLLKPNFHRSSSTFTSDMCAALNSPLYSDIQFRIPPGECPTNLRPNQCLGFSRVKEADRGVHVYYAHRALLVQMGYFEGLLSGMFGDIASAAGQLTGLEVGSKESIGIGTSLLHQPAQEMDIDGFLEDGIDVQTFLSVLHYAYTATLEPSDSLGEGRRQSPNGNIHSSDPKEEAKKKEAEEEEEESEDLTLTMHLLVAANRFSFPRLVAVCERILVSHLRDVFPDNAVNCLAFARTFDYIRLERKCEEALRLGSAGEVE